MKNTGTHHLKGVDIAVIGEKMKEKGEIVMATKKKATKKEEEVITPVEEKEEIKEETTPVETVKKEEKPVNKKKEPKYPIGSVVYISKEADADLEGFKLFPQYKKYAYTVEAYNDDTGVYSLRRLNLSLKLKEALIINPDERAHDGLNRKQF